METTTLKEDIMEQQLTENEQEMIIAAVNGDRSACEMVLTWTVELEGERVPAAAKFYAEAVQAKKELAK